MLKSYLERNRNWPGASMGMAGSARADFPAAAACLERCKLCTLRGVSSQEWLGYWKSANTVTPADPWIDNSRVHAGGLFSELSLPPLFR
ncbi:MAG: hypothetical protein JWO94_3579 [Verrucomicrobiaceae bacterium]|nr:hypothetical protein [Verrucomicrobiaceae bacterium]